VRWGKNKRKQTGRKRRREKKNREKKEKLKKERENKMEKKKNLILKFPDKNLEDIMELQIIYLNLMKRF